MAEVSLISYNVNYGKNVKGEANFEAVKQELEIGGAEVIAMQLAPEVYVNELASALSFKAVYHHVHNGFGLAVLARPETWSITRHSMHTLGVPPQGHETRGVLCCQLSRVGGPLRCGCQAKLPELNLFVTHLDNTSEDVRLMQLQELKRHLPADVPHVLCGDFNALNKADYGPGTGLETDKWAQLVGFARERGWEERREDVILAVDSWGYRDCFLEAGMSQQLNGGAVEMGFGGHFPYTFQMPGAGFHLRLDYVFASPNFPLRARVCGTASSDFLRQDTDPPRTSPHSALVCNFCADSCTHVHSKQ